MKIEYLFKKNKMRQTSTMITKLQHECLVKKVTTHIRKIHRIAQTIL